VTVVLIVVVVALVIALALLAAEYARSGRRAPRSGKAGAVAVAALASRRVLFPFQARALSEPALDAALRLAHSEDATLVPVFLARVGMQLPLDAPLPRQSAVAIPLQEAIEQRAASFGVPVDARIERGRTPRHALRMTIEHERFDRIVIAAAGHGGVGLDADDVAWLLQTAPGEIVVLRPAPNGRSPVG
jgi:nucleotide-binding universal stress UspA family protein